MQATNCPCSRRWQCHKKFLLDSIRGARGIQHEVQAPLVGYLGKGGSHSKHLLSSRQSALTHPYELRNQSLRENVGLWCAQRTLGWPVDVRVAGVPAIAMVALQMLCTVIATPDQREHHDLNCFITACIAAYSRLPNLDPLPIAGEFAAGGDVGKSTCVTGREILF